MAAGDGALTTELTGLTPSTNYVVQVQAVLANGKTTDWSPVEKFTTLDEGEIALYDDLDNQDVIDENDGKEVKATLQGRKLYKDDSWNTLCLPFTTAITSLTGDLADATLMELDTDAGNYEHVTGYENGTLYLNFKPATTIEAGKPYIIKWADTEEVIENPVFEGVTIVGGEAGSVTSTGNGDVTFVGTYSPVDIYTPDKTTLYMAADNTLYYPWGDGMTSFMVNALRAFFRLNNGIVCGEPEQGGSINAFVLNFGGEDATEIVSLSDKFDSTDQSDGWYTLSGMKLNGKPISKGIYIKNGRKIVVK